MARRAPSIPRRCRQAQSFEDLLLDRGRKKPIFPIGQAAYFSELLAQGIVSGIELAAQCGKFIELLSNEFDRLIAFGAQPAAGQGSSMPSRIAGLPCGAIAIKSPPPQPPRPRCASQNNQN
jgi:hypothetical protein